MKNIKTYDDFVNEEINLKKALTGVALGASLLGGMSSCKKEPLNSSVTLTSKEESPAPPPSENCNCGTIIDDKILIVNDDLVYTLTVRNRCSQNVQTFYVNHDTWLHGHVGNQICFYDISSWREIKNPENYEEIKHINKQIMESVGIKRYDNFYNEEINLKKIAVGTALGASLMGGVTSCEKKNTSPIYMSVSTMGYKLISYKDDCSLTNDSEINADVVGKSGAYNKSKKYQINSGTYNFEYILDQHTAYCKYTGTFTIIKNKEKEPINWTFYLASIPIITQYKTSSNIQQLPDTVVDLSNGKVIISTKMEIINQ
jgi:hypothetical protein